MGTGALVGGLSLGLVLNYQGAGVPNFAIGAVAMLGAFEFYTLKQLGKLFIPLPGVPLVSAGSPWPTWSAFVVALLVCALVGVLFDVLVLGRLRTSSPLAKLVASLGLLLTLQAIAVQRFGVGGQSAPAVIPENPDDLVHVFGSAVPYDRFIFTGIVIVGHGPARLPLPLHPVRPGHPGGGRERGHRGPDRSRPPTDLDRQHGARLRARRSRSAC